MYVGAALPPLHKCMLHSHQSRTAPTALKAWPRKGAWTAKLTMHGLVFM